MNKDPAEIKRQIAELEAELPPIYGITRDEVVERVLTGSSEYQRQLRLDGPDAIWLDCLQWLKFTRDTDPNVWGKMLRMD